MLNLSANIERGINVGDHYIVTPNAERVSNEIINQYVSGVHSFCIIGTYGTGKSSFLLHFEEDLKCKGGELVRNTQLLNEHQCFEFLNIVGDYAPFEELLANRLLQLNKNEQAVSDQKALDLLRTYLKQLKKQGRTLIIAIDEFGKLLEYAASNNPERELYFMQKLCELVNSPHYQVVFVTTLHQNFSAYASKLSDVQRDEWNKVKGRFQEVVFAEPIAQLIYLAAETISTSCEQSAKDDRGFRHLYTLVQQTKFATPDFEEETALKLYPLEGFSAFVITQAIQRYGQNERSLFSFLQSNGAYSLRQFKSDRHLPYNLTNVYDYIINNFHSYLVETNSDTMYWSLIRSAIERVEALNWDDDTKLTDAISLVKVIGLLNMFGNAGFIMQPEQLISYANHALKMSTAQETLKELLQFKIVRFAQYKQRLILFEGTDVNLEYEFQHAGTIVPKPVNYIDDLRLAFNRNVAPVKAYYYQKGTPRYYEYMICEAPIDIVPTGDIDGYIELVFSNQKHGLKTALDFSEQCEHAIIIAYFNQTEQIVDHLYNIQKYQYILDTVLVDQSDRVALREVNNQLAYERMLLNKSIKDDLFNYTENVIWIYKGKKRRVSSLAKFNQLLSEVCDDIYSQTPVMNNELFNRHKLSGAISAARVKYLQALTEHYDQIDLGFEQTKFPPEKAIYYSLLKNTGLHTGSDFADVPSNVGILTLWKASEKFLQSTIEKKRKVSDLIKLLSNQPYKMKEGFIDFWIPTYLFIKRQDYALYGKAGQYIPEVNMQFFELLKKHPADYLIKAFTPDGVKLAFFNQYRKFIHAGEQATIKGEKFVETIKPFFFFYNHLNEYAKLTRKFDHIETLKFRDVLSKAQDPEQTFFETLPEALGYDSAMLRKADFIESYCSKLQEAVRELRGCYHALIDRIERSLIIELGLDSTDYEDYVVELRKRFHHLKVYLLTEKQKDFYNHVMTEFADRVEWYQSICYAALGQPLERLRDEQEDILIEKLVYLFRECEKQIVVSNEMNYHITESDQHKARLAEKQIEQMLSGNNDLDIHILLNVLKRKMQ